MRGRAAGRALRVVAFAGVTLGVICGATAAGLALATPHLLLAADLAASPARVAEVPLDRVVAAACAAALTGCWGWLVAALLATLGTALRHAPAGTPPVAVPRWAPVGVRVLVVAALGAGLAAPANAGTLVPQPPSAAGGPVRSLDLVGLPVPDRVATAATAPAQAVPTVRVRRGDSLWSIASTLLPVGAADAAVHRGSRLLALANRDRLGPDPDLIYPGTALRVPRLLIAPGKELL